MWQCRVPGLAAELGATALRAVLGSIRPSCGVISQLTESLRRSGFTGHWRVGRSNRPYCTVRLDIVEGPFEAPSAIYDYKYGGARLPQSRVDHILKVAGLDPSVPVLEVRPAP